MLTLMDTDEALPKVGLPKSLSGKFWPTGSWELQYRWELHRKSARDARSNHEKYWYHESEDGGHAVRVSVLMLTNKVFTFPYTEYNFTDSPCTESTPESWNGPRPVHHVVNVRWKKKHLITVWKLALLVQIMLQPYRASKEISQNALYRSLEYLITWQI